MKKFGFQSFVFVFSGGVMIYFDRIEVVNVLSSAAGNYPPFECWFCSVRITTNYRSTQPDTDRLMEADMVRQTGSKTLAHT